MTRLLVKGRSSDGTLHSVGALSASRAYEEAESLKCAGFDHVTVENLDTGERIADVTQLVEKRSAYATRASALG